MKRITLILLLFVASSLKNVEAGLALTIPSSYSGTNIATLLQNDLDSISSAGGGILTIQAGNYSVNSAINFNAGGLTSWGPVRITGAGQSATVLTFTASGAALTWNRSSYDSTLAIDNIGLQSTVATNGLVVVGPNPPSGAPAYQDPSNYDNNEFWHKTLNLSSVAFSGFSEAVAIDYPCWNSNIANCVFTAPAGATQTGTIGVGVNEYISNSLFSGCSFTGYDNAIQLAQPVDPSSSDLEGIECLNNTFTGVNYAINGTASLGIGWIDIQHNTISVNNNGWAIALLNPSFAGITNNTISAASGSPALLGVYLEAGQMCTISGNTFSYISNSVVLTQSNSGGTQFSLNEFSLGCCVFGNSISNGITGVWLQGGTTSPPVQNTQNCVVGNNSYSGMTGGSTLNQGGTTNLLY